MIDLDEAAPSLRPLAAPTLEAFAEAVRISHSIQNATVTVRPRAARPVLGLLDGISHRAYYATCLTEQYASIGLERDARTHQLTYAWDVNSRIRLQLKSDTTALDVQQLTIPGMQSYGSVGPSLVALTWKHDATGRHGPSFAHITADGPIWQIPVASLLDSATAAASPSPRRPSVSSRLTPASNGEAERGSEGSS